MSCLDLTHEVRFSLPAVRLVLERKTLSACVLQVEDNGIVTPPPICLTKGITEMQVEMTNGIRQLIVSHVAKHYPNAYLFELGLHCTDLQIVDGKGIGVADVRDNFRQGIGIGFDLAKVKMRISQTKNGTLEVMVLTFDSKKHVVEEKSPICK